MHLTGAELRQGALVLPDSVVDLTGATLSKAFRIVELKLSRMTLTEAEMGGDGEHFSINSTLVPALMCRFFDNLRPTNDLGGDFHIKKDSGVHRWSDNATSIVNTEEEVKPFVITKSRVWPRL